MKLIYKNQSGLEVFAKTKEDDGYEDGHYYEARHTDIGDSEVHTELGELNFQNGPIPVAGVNGWTNEALLAVLINRTEVLNNKFHSEENDRALFHMKCALDAFDARTARRVARGVEGKLVK